MDKVKVLVVDDEELLVEMMRLRLEANGYEVIAAYDGKQGLDLARKEKPNIIILDIMLPKMDGYKVCRMLKFDAEYKDIPIILSTARGQDSDKDLGKEVGANAYITKPFEPEELLSIIEKLLI